MSDIFRSDEGEQILKARYQALLDQWPVPCHFLHPATGQGETFVVASGAEDAPPVLLLHGSAGNSVAWMKEVAVWALHFRVLTLDMIGEPGLSAPSRPALDSPAHAEWLDEVLDSLEVQQAALVGNSLGGWLALDYAIRRPHRVSRLALLAPGGVGDQRRSFIFKVIALRLFGESGKRKLREMILGKPPEALTPLETEFFEFLTGIYEHFRPRVARLPIFTDDDLAGLEIPVLAFLGGRDIILDSAGTKRRLETQVANATVRYSPATPHLITGHTDTITDFLREPHQT